MKDRKRRIVDDNRQHELVIVNIAVSAPVDVMEHRRRLVGGQARLKGCGPSTDPSECDVLNDWPRLSQIERHRYGLCSFAGLMIILPSLCGQLQWLSVCGKLK